MASDCLGKVTIGLLKELTIAEFRFVAEVRQVILSFSPRRGGVGEKAAGVTQLIESDVAQRDVFFEFGSVGNPGAEALRKYERVVSEAHRVARNRLRCDLARGGNGFGGHRI